MHLLRTPESESTDTDAPAEVTAAYVMLRAAFAGLGPCPRCGTEPSTRTHPPVVTVEAVTDSWHKGYGNGYLAEPELRLRVECRTLVLGGYRRRCGEVREVTTPAAVSALNTILTAALRGGS